MSGAGVTVTVAREAAGVPVATVGLVHGLGASASVWAPLVGLLPPTVRAWSFGLPWDASDGAGWALERDSRVWLERALAAAPGAPDVFVAHSFGANVLLDLIDRRGSARCRGLVAISPFYRATPGAFDWAAISHYLNDFDELVRTGILLRGNAPRPGSELLEPMVEKVRERIGPYGWLRFFELFSRTPLLDLSAVDAPCLVIGGGRDTAAYPDDCRSLARALPDAAVHILPASGHFSMCDDAPRVAALVRDFLGRLGYPTRYADTPEGAAT